jgi:hypothetical protein
MYNHPAYGWEGVEEGEKPPLWSPVPDVDGKASQAELVEHEKKYGPLF